MKIDLEFVKELRRKTGAGVLECREALEKAEGNMEKAVELLREKGAAVALKRAGKIAKEGIVSAYIHSNNKVGVLLEINCETDFVAKTEEFRNFAKELCLQIAAMAPEYVSRDEVPEELVEKEKQIYRTQALSEGKPEKAIEKIVAGRLDKFYSTVCLLDQIFIRDEKRKVSDLLTELIGKLGEKIVIRRFVRFQVGEETSKS